MSKTDSALSKTQLDLLKQFKKQISAGHTETKSNSMTKQPIYTAAEAEQPDDAQIFSQAMQGVKRINASDMANLNPAKKNKKPNPQILARRMAAEGGTELEHAELSDMQALMNPVASQAFLSYRIATLQHRVFEDLKAGNLRWYEAVDLHGCTIEQAREAVLEIIQLARSDNQTVIKIVHGKGDNGVLKTCVNGWLRQHRSVLAFVSAPDNQGGTGAVLVLLKRAENNPKEQELR